MNIEKNDVGFILGFILILFTIMFLVNNFFPAP
jgi:hypothetical protein